MAFPPRPRSSRAEPSFTPIGAAPRDAVPLRPAAPRPAAMRPAPSEAQGQREPMRLATEHRREPQSLSLSAEDRLVVSSAVARSEPRRQGGFGFFRLLGFAVLLALAAVGAYNIYHWASAFLP
jgi:hypothetical protein